MGVGIDPPRTIHAHRHRKWCRGTSPLAAATASLARLAIPHDGSLFRLRGAPTETTSRATASHAGSALKREMRWSPSRGAGAESHWAPSFIHVMNESAHPPVVQAVGAFHPHIAT